MLLAAYNGRFLSKSNPAISGNSEKVTIGNVAGINGIIFIFIWDFSSAGFGILMTNITACCLI